MSIIRARRGRESESNLPPGARGDRESEGNSPPGWWVKSSIRSLPNSPIRVQIERETKTTWSERVSRNVTYMDEYSPCLVNRLHGQSHCFHRLIYLRVRIFICLRVQLSFTYHGNLQVLRAWQETSDPSLPPALDTICHIWRGYIFLQTAPSWPLPYPFRI